jgi:hypothetical protein
LPRLNQLFELHRGELKSRRLCLFKITTMPLECRSISLIEAPEKPPESDKSPSHCMIHASSDSFQTGISCIVVLTATMANNTRVMRANVTGNAIHAHLTLIQVE